MKTTGTNWTWSFWGLVGVWHNQSQRHKTRTSSHTVTHIYCHTHARRIFLPMHFNTEIIQQTVGISSNLCPNFPFKKMWEQKASHQVKIWSLLGTWKLTHTWCASGASWVYWIWHCLMPYLVQILLWMIWLISAIHLLNLKLANHNRMPNNLKKNKTGTTTASSLRLYGIFFFTSPRRGEKVSIWIYLSCLSTNFVINLCEYL